MAKFRPVNPKVDFIALEKKLLSRWYEGDVVPKYLHKNDSSDKTFSFLDGPITANNPMGVHHAWGRTYKDLFQRFKNMQGYKQRFQNGFDCQGLWVEVQVEKDLGLKSKKDIENLVPGDVKESIAKFVELCKERVYKFSAVQTEQSKRLGYFMDWENSYFTLSNNNNYMIWTFLKKCHEKGLIYKGHDSVPWCPRCGTAISQHEMLTEDYKEITHESVFVMYPVKGKDFSLLVWTTTPWTLLANVAVAVDPNLEYVEVEKNNKSYVLAKGAVKRVLGEATVIKEYRGAELVGLEYTSPFDHLERVEKAMNGQSHKVVATNPLILPISAEEGTGLVHMAPGAGAEDFQLGKELKLPVLDVIDEEANYLPGMERFSGQNAKDNPEIILNYIKEAESGKYFFDTLKYTHRYPACWRCHSELVWRVVDEWYISMDPLRNPMKDVARKIKWIPEFGLKRELDWLDNMRDWLISKKRYWGLALPIWECQVCGGFQVIGDEKELGEKTVEGWDDFEGHSPHRPYVDEIKIKCEKCGGLATRVPDVGNPWLDAGIVPFSTISEDNKNKPLYRADKNEWRKWFPADFITESFPGQFKNWFYSLIAMSTVLENEEPFKTVLGFATLLAEDGRPMHKSWGNMVEFNEGADTIGVDVMRWMYAKQDPATNMLFGYKAGEQTKRRFHLMLWNIYNFFVTYVNLSEWENMDAGESTNVLDSWIIARLYETLRIVTDSLEQYDARTGAFSIEEFVQDLSLWYVRRSRDRVGQLATDEDRNACFSTLHKVLVILSKLLMPFTPFLADEIYTNLTGEESVNLCDWPETKEVSDLSLIAQMGVARSVVERGHAARKLANIPVRQPLPKLSVVHSVEALQEEVLQLIEEELNVKNVLWKMKAGTELRVELDTNITPELEEEGKARELARLIQDERKKLGTPLNAKVTVTAPWVPENPQVVEWLKKRTLSTQISKGDTLQVEWES
ncbi:MAG: isoleucine--tRNA ligase [Candidatus Blackburnbacteria bacterium]|nr:isoleucine--tRNA ligase [Candidatus Blackburnbacteria bacterium]